MFGLQFSFRFFYKSQQFLAFMLHFYTKCKGFTEWHLVLSSVSVSFYVISVNLWPALFSVFISRLWSFTSEERKKAFSMCLWCVCSFGQSLFSVKFEGWKGRNIGAAGVTEIPLRWKREESFWFVVEIRAESGGTFMSGVWTRSGV